MIEQYDYSRKGEAPDTPGARDYLGDLVEEQGGIEDFSKKFSEEKEGRGEGEGENDPLVASLEKYLNGPDIDPDIEESHEDETDDETEETEEALIQEDEETEGTSKIRMWGRTVSKFIASQITPRVENTSERAGLLFTTALSELSKSGLIEVALAPGNPLLAGAIGTMLGGGAALNRFQRVRMGPLDAVSTLVLEHHDHRTVEIIEEQMKSENVLNTARAALKFLLKEGTGTLVAFALERHLGFEKRDVRLIEALEREKLATSTDEDGEEISVALLEFDEFTQHLKEPHTLGKKIDQLVEDNYEEAATLFQEMMTQSLLTKGFQHLYQGKQEAYQATLVLLGAKLSQYIEEISVTHGEETLENSSSPLTDVLFKGVETQIRNTIEIGQLRNAYILTSAAQRGLNTAAWAVFLNRLPGILQSGFDKIAPRIKEFAPGFAKESVGTFLANTKQFFKTTGAKIYDTWKWASPLLIEPLMKRREALPEKDKLKKGIEAQIQNGESVLISPRDGVIALPVHKTGESAYTIDTGDVGNFKEKNNIPDTEGGDPTARMELRFNASGVDASGDGQYLVQLSYPGASDITESLTSPEGISGRFDIFIIDQDGKAKKISNAGWDGSITLQEGQEIGIAATKTKGLKQNRLSLSKLEVGDFIEDSKKVGYTQTRMHDQLVSGAVEEGADGNSIAGNISIPMQFGRSESAICPMSIAFCADNTANPNEKKLAAKLITEVLQNEIMVRIKQDPALEAIKEKIQRATRDSKLVADRYKNLTKQEVNMLTGVIHRALYNLDTKIALLPGTEMAISLAGCIPIGDKSIIFAVGKADALVIHQCQQPASSIQPFSEKNPGNQQRSRTPLGVLGREYIAEKSLDKKDLQESNREQRKAFINEKNGATTYRLYPNLIGIAYTGSSKVMLTASTHPINDLTPENAKTIRNIINETTDPPDTRPDYEKTRSLAKNALLDNRPANGPENQPSPAQNATFASQIIRPSTGALAKRLPAKSRPISAARAARIARQNSGLVKQALKNYADEHENIENSDLLYTKIKRAHSRIPTDPSRKRVMQRKFVHRRSALQPLYSRNTDLALYTLATICRENDLRDPEALKNYFVQQVIETADKDVLLHYVAALGQVLTWLESGRVDHHWFQENLQRVAIPESDDNGVGANGDRGPTQQELHEGGPY